MGEVIGLWTTILKNTRKQLELSQKQLGTLLNYSATWISQAEHDEDMAQTALRWINATRGDMDWPTFRQFAKNYIEEYGR